MRRSCIRRSRIRQNAGPWKLHARTAPAFWRTRLPSWWHSDADLGRTIETFTDMSKSRRVGFLEYQETSNSFLDLFDRLRAERIIPPLGPSDK